jgi:hypothetical protein
MNYASSFQRTLRNTIPSWWWDLSRPDIGVCHEQVVEHDRALALRAIILK